MGLRPDRRRWRGIERKPCLRRAGESITRRVRDALAAGNGVPQSDQRSRRAHVRTTRARASARGPNAAGARPCSAHGAAFCHGASPTHGYACADGDTASAHGDAYAASALRHTGAADGNANATGPERYRDGDAVLAGKW